MSSGRDDRLARAMRLRENGELEDARVQLLELRAESPHDARIALQTAWVHDSMGFAEEAVEHYRAALAGEGELTDEELRGGLLGLGSTYRALGRDDESDRTLREGIERFPDFRPLRVFHALTLYSLGTSRDAVRQLVEVLLDSTGDPDVLRYRRALTAYADDLDRSWLEPGG